MSKLNWAWEWVKARLKYAAMAAIGYGAFRIWQEEKQDANG